MGNRHQHRGRRCLRLPICFLAAFVWLATNAQPAAPGGLRATAGDGDAVLAWRDPSNSNVVRYELRFGAGEAPEFNAWDAVPGSDADTIEHTVSGLANGTRYVFELRAVDEGGAGEAASASTMLAESPSSAVEVPDAELRGAIEQVLELAAGASITQGDLAKLRELRAGQLEVADLAGLEFAANLVTLWLPSNAIEDVSPLSGLTALRVLGLDSNAISDVSALSALTSLTVLGLSSNAIEDVSPLSGLTSLERLGLSSNAIEDVSALSALTALERLWLFGNAIEDVSPLSGLTSLTDLRLYDNAIEDVSPLSGLTSLTVLGLSFNAIEDVSPLSGLTSLEWLTLDDSAIADVSPLSGLTALTRLWLGDNAIEDVSPLSGLTSLRDLNLHSNAIEDVSPLSGLTALEWLYLSSNQIKNVAHLSGLTALTVLRLDSNAIPDVSSLGGLEELSSLYLNRNAVADISPLLDSGLRGAGKYADLRGNPLGEGQAEHVQALREAGAVVVFDDGHRVPLFPSAAGSSVAGFVRVINHSDEGGSVSIEAVDETGGRLGPVSLDIDAGQALHFNAGDLEQGNPAKGLRGIGEAVGDWRLVLRSELDIEVLGYARTPDGFVTSLHDLAPEAYLRARVPTFNPGGNRRQASRLRLTNPTASERYAQVSAWDDEGGGSYSRLSVPAHRTLDLAAAQLESGQESGEDGVAFRGLGDGAGKWRFTVFARGLRVMSLLQSPTGHLSNISTGTAVLEDERAYFSWYRGGRYRVPLFLAASSDIQGFLRIVNLSGEMVAISLRAFDEAGVEREPAAVLTLQGGEALHLNSNDLESGNAAKGLPGIGAAVGDWHLEVSGDRRFEVLAYARTADGFVTSLHDTAPRLEDGSLWIPFFNPGSNRAQASRLRLVNWGEDAAEATITGVDDAGESPGGAVRVSLPARSARDYMAWELETGEHADLSGALGDGDGKWRLRVSAPAEVEALSLLGLPTGHVTNLSTTPRCVEKRANGCR